jgi:hypothetical protein
MEIDWDLALPGFDAAFADLAVEEDAVIPFGL